MSLRSRLDRIASNQPAPIRAMPDDQLDTRLRELSAKAAVDFSLSTEHRELAAESLAGELSAAKAARLITLLRESIHAEKSERICNE